MNTPVNIALVDDHMLTRNGLKVLIEKIGPFKVMMEACNGEDILEQLTTTNLLPDICFLDISMPGMGGVETLKKLQKSYPSIYVIICTLYSDLVLVNEVMFQGANGFICKNCGFEELLITINQVNYQRINNIREIKDKPNTYYPNLIEIEILKLLRLDRSSKQIATHLNISINSVNGHIQSLYTKLNIHNRAALIDYAHRIGIYM